MSKLYITPSGVDKLAQALSIVAHYYPRNPSGDHILYGVPRGGVVAAYALARHLSNTCFTTDPQQATLIVDDLIDSGRTLEFYRDKHPAVPFIALIDKRTNKDDRWIVFPWESDTREEDDSIVGTIKNRIASNGGRFFANDNISDYFASSDELVALREEVERRAKHLLDALIIDQEHDHNTQGTAKRMSKMYCEEVFAGRFQPAPAITDFPNASKLDEIYFSGPITIRSTCSHHFCPIIGQCWIGVLPSDRVIGLSKFNRIVNWICSRPQIQEEMAVQLADYLEKIIKPKGLAVVIKATHTCMTWRGVKEGGGCSMTNSIMRGVFRDKPEARAEFLALLKL